jgi:DNA-binding NarL/FixJ family response regulator
MLPPLKDAPPATDASAGRVITVVLADDDDSYRAGMVRAFERSDGVTLVAVAKDGRQALTAARELHPDVLLVDEHMPGLSGTEIAERVQGDWRLVGVRVVVMSADENPELSRRARTAGVVTCIDKVRSRREIIAAIRNVGR